jgi:tetratricopeptide (TPR) repeat protein
VEQLNAISPQWNGDVARGMKELRDGFHSLRRGELTRDQDAYDRALRKFEWATGSATGWPYPWFGMALTYFGMKRQGFQNRGVVFKEMADYTGFYIEGDKALHRALERDPTFAPALDLLSTMMTDEGDRMQWPWRVRALEHASVTDPRVDLVLGRAYRRAEDFGEALARFDRYLANGGSHAVARLERARTLSALGQVEAAVAAYRAGLWHADSHGRALYREDLSWIFTVEELDRFDAVPDDSLVPWLHRFWRERDVSAVRPPGERLREHLRRWNVVSRSFRVPDPWQKAWLNPPMIQEIGPCTVDRPQMHELQFPNPSRPNDLRAGEPVYDNRAVIYMRHGEPSRKVFVRGPLESDLLQTYPMVIDGLVRGDVEGWIYRMDGVPRAYHFIYHKAIGWGTSLNSVFFSAEYFRALALADESFNRGAAYVEQATGPGDAAFAESFARLDAGALNLSASATARAPWLNYFDREDTAVPYGCSAAIKRLAERTQEDLTTGVTTDTYTPVFPRTLLATVRAFGLPRADESPGGIGLVVFAVPMTDLPLDTLETGDRTVSLRFRITAQDTVQGTTAWLDTVRTFRLPPQTAPETKLTGYLELPVAPGTFILRSSVAAADSSVGAAVRLPAIAVDHRADGLAISDLVPGRREDGLAWRYGNTAVALNPLHTYRPSDVATLFYVLDGLVPERQYRTTITLRRWNDDDNLVTFSFEETAQSGRQVVERALGLQDLAHGRYLVTLHLLEMASGRTVERQQIINVLDQAR